MSAILKTLVAGFLFLGLLSGCDGADEEYFERANITSKNIDLVQEAHAGDVEAMEQLIACIEKADPWPQQNVQIYYWLNRLKLAGVETAATRQADMEKVLPEEDKAFLESWFKDLPDTPMMPFVTEINCFAE